MRKRYSRTRRSSENHFWQSYSDMMTSMLMVMILVLVGTVLQAQKTFEAKEQEMQNTQALLSEKEAQLETQESEIAQKEGELRAKEKELDEINDKYSVLRTDMQKILGVRQSIIMALKNAFQDNVRLTVNEEGSIVFDSELLFDTDDSQLKASGQEFLSQFIPQYMDILMKSSFSEYISEIIIEGHADVRGPYLHNLELSQNRALSVASYILADDSGMFQDENEIASLRKIITANGRSWSKPVYYPGTEEVNLDASRRVEIQFRLKDDEMIRQMSQMIENTQ